MGIESFTKKFTFPIPLFNKGMENVNFIIGSIITKKKIMFIIFSQQILDSILLLVLF